MTLAGLLGLSRIDRGRFLDIHRSRLETLGVDPESRFIELDSASQSFADWERSVAEANNERDLEYALLRIEPHFDSAAHHLGLRNKGPFPYENLIPAHMRTHHPDFAHAIERQWDFLVRNSRGTADLREVAHSPDFFYWLHRFVRSYWTDNLRGFNPRLPLDTWWNQGDDIFDPLTSPYELDDRSLMDQLAFSDSELLGLYQLPGFPRHAPKVTPGFGFQGYLAKVRNYRFQVRDELFAELKAGAGTSSPLTLHSLLAAVYNGYKNMAVYAEHTSRLSYTLGSEFVKCLTEAIDYGLFDGMHEPHMVFTFAGNGFLERSIAATLQQKYRWETWSPRTFIDHAPYPLIFMGNHDPRPLGNNFVFEHINAQTHPRQLGNIIEDHRSPKPFGPEWMDDPGLLLIRINGTTCQLPDEFESELGATLPYINDPNNRVAYLIPTTAEREQVTYGDEEDHIHAMVRDDYLLVHPDDRAAFGSAVERVKLDEDNFYYSIRFRIRGNPVLHNQLTTDRVTLANGQNIEVNRSTRYSPKWINRICIDYGLSVWGDPKRDLVVLLTNR